jgi:L-serine deaminase
LVSAEQPRKPNPKEKSVDEDLGIDEEIKRIEREMKKVWDALSQCIARASESDDMATRLVRDHNELARKLKVLVAQKRSQSS